MKAYHSDRLAHPPIVAKLRDVIAHIGVLGPVTRHHLILVAGLVVSDNYAVLAGGERLGGEEGDALALPIGLTSRHPNEEPIFRFSPRGTLGMWTLGVW